MARHVFIGIRWSVLVIVLTGCTWADRGAVIAYGDQSWDLEIRTLGPPTLDQGLTAEDLYYEGREGSVTLEELAVEVERLKKELVTLRGQVFKLQARPLSQPNAVIEPRRFQPVESPELCLCS